MKRVRGGEEGGGEGRGGRVASLLVLDLCLVGPFSLGRGSLIPALASRLL